MRPKFLAYATRRFAALKKPERIYISFIAGLLIAIVVLSALKQLFWLNLISTFLALASGGLGSLTKTTEEKDGRSRLARPGWILLVLFALSGVTAAVTAFVQRSSDREADAQKERKLQGQQELIGTLSKSMSEQNTELKKAKVALEAANAKLDRQNIKVEIQAELLRKVGRDIREERTAIHKVELAWSLWLRPLSDSYCIIEFLRLSEELPNPSEKEQKGKRLITKRFPELGTLSEGCRGVIEDSLGTSQVDFRFFKSTEQLKVMDRTSFTGNEAIQSGKGWSFTVFSKYPYPRWSYYKWDENRGVMILYFGAEVAQEQLKRPDGTSVSLYDLSGASVVMRFDHHSLTPSVSDGYGIDCVTVVFNSRLPYGFGEKGICKGNFREFLSEKAASLNSWPEKASYQATLPKIIE